MWVVGVEGPGGRGRVQVRGAAGVAAASSSPLLLSSASPSAVAAREPWRWGVAATTGAEAGRAEEGREVVR